MSSQNKCCNRCRQTKPIAEFYERTKGSGDRFGHCRDCDNARPRRRSLSKVVRVRARHRAVAELIRRHDDEFRDLLDHFTDAAAEEAEQLAMASPEAVDERGVTPLRAGSKRPGQKATDRIDVARCPHCIKAHDRGHACGKCGYVPKYALHRANDGVIDEIAIERRIAGEAVALTTPELAEAVRVLAARRCSPTDITRRLGVSGARVNQILRSTEGVA